ncbi:hypothetical protein OAV63_02365 [Gammaproteobacteria bacterium]|nr:hypothetical protein [Gammaproteobacteria bacterium]
MDMEGLNKLLTELHDMGIICPTPRAWNHLWTNIFKGFDEDWKSEEERHKNYPLLLSAWGIASDKAKKKRFVNSVKYFYINYPNKRKRIEKFLINNDKWFMGWDN